MQGLNSTKLGSHALRFDFSATWRSIMKVMDAYIKGLFLFLKVAKFLMTNRSPCNIFVYNLPCQWFNLVFILVSLSSCILPELCITE